MLQVTHSRETRDAAKEVKFLVTPDQASQILDWARPRLAPDPYAGGAAGDDYRTTSLYFDTADFAVFERRGSFRRSKYRIRRYGVSDVVFMERKLRTAVLLSKRRTAVPIGDLERLEGPTEDTRLWTGDWFAQRLRARRLGPVCQVSYHRHARVGIAPYGPMRLTFDNEIVAQPCSQIKFAPQNGVTVLEDSVILEMKYCSEVPAVFKDLVETFSLSPTTMSKYRLSIGAIQGVEAAVGLPAGQRAFRPATDASPDREG